MLTATQRTELNHRILSTLTESDQGVRAAALAQRLQLPQRDVVGRLQALKRREMVTYERDGSTPSAPGLWAVSEQGRQMVSQTDTVAVERYAIETERRELWFYSTDQGQRVATTR
jgi:DNA-binding IclR family transcriptional regulator